MHIHPINFRILLLVTSFICANLTVQARDISPLLSSPGKSSGSITVAPTAQINRLLYFGSCVKNNALITLEGIGFGASGSGKRIGFKGKFHHHATASSWSEKKITVRLPVGVQGKLPQQYYVGLENTSEKWLSNINRSIPVCGLLVSPQSGIDKSVSISGSGSKPPLGESVDTGTAPVYDGTTGPLTPSISQYGTDSQLPPVPEDLPPLPAKKDKTIDPGELLVASSNMAQAQALARKVQALGLRIKRRRHLKSLNMVVSVFRVPKQLPVRDALLKLRQLAPKTWADTNTRYQLQSSKDHNYGAKLIGWNTPKTSGYCGKGFRLGLVDTEVNKHHPALKGKAITSRSFLTPGIKKATAQHGTATAAILIGDSHKKEITGLIRGARLYVASVFRQRSGNKVDTTVEGVVSGLDWLASQGVTLINLGLGGPRNLLLEAAIKRLISRGVLVIAPAGNGGPRAPAVYPAAQREVLAVTAIDALLRPYNMANRGEYISFSAPGVDVWTARAKGGFMYVSGTSFATPFVTASVIAVKQAHKKWPWQKVIKHMIASVRDLGRAGKDPTFGWGLVQASGKCTQ